jgi:hypothetical protein
MQVLHSLSDKLEKRASDCIEREGNMVLVSNAVNIYELQ